MEGEEGQGSAGVPKEKVISLAQSAQTHLTQISKVKNVQKKLKKFSFSGRKSAVGQSAG